MQLKMHQKAKTAEQNKSGSFKFLWDSKKKKKKNQSSFFCCYEQLKMQRDLKELFVQQGMVKQALEWNYATFTTFPNWFHTNSCDEQTEIYKACISHSSKAGATDINICAKMSRFSQAAATLGSFVVATDVLKGHLWWGESPCNDFLSGKEYWYAGKHIQGVFGSGKEENTQAFFNAPLVWHPWS